MDEELPSWVIQAAQMPLTFAQQREDATVDLAVLDQLAPGAAPGAPTARERGAAVMLVAAGGDTAAAMAASGRCARLCLIDVNSTQVSLARLKLELLASASPELRLGVLGHGSMAVTDRRRLLEGFMRRLMISPLVFGPSSFVAQVGPDYAGRFELLLCEFRMRLAHFEAGIGALMTLRDPAEQAARVAPGTSLGQAIDAALERVMTLPVLATLLGADHAANAAEPMPRHFARRLRHALASAPAADNPYLAQVLLGHFPREVCYPWHRAPAPPQMPQVSFAVMPIRQALAEAAPGSFDVVQLSNVLDALVPPAAARTLAAAARALRPGGLVLLRQLNSLLDVRALPGEFDWLDDLSDQLARAERSVLYNAVHVGRRR